MSKGTELADRLVMCAIKYDEAYTAYASCIPDNIDKKLVRRLRRRKQELEKTYVSVAESIDND